jgi:hypothetical protein
MTAEAASLGAQLARDTVGRWIRGTTVPTLAALRAVEDLLSDRLGAPVNLAEAVGERRAARRSRQVADGARGGEPKQAEFGLDQVSVRLRQVQADLAALFDQLGIWRPDDSSRASAKNPRFTGREWLCA